MKIKMITIIGLLFITQASISGPETTVKFNQPEKFTDFKIDQNTSANEMNKLTNELSNLMIKSASKALAKNNRLEIIVENVDMAGTFLYQNSDFIRTVRDTDRMSLDFSYQLFSSDGTMIKQDTVNLTSRNPKIMNKQRYNNKNSHFTYEMQLFDLWLKKLYK